MPQHVSAGYKVARAWGFVPYVLMAWCKSGLGMGSFRNNVEYVVVARRGDLKFAQTHSGLWFNWKRQGHAVKPDGFFDLVEKTSPGPRLEMFARRPRRGWKVWGNEVDSDVKIAP